MIVIDQLLCLLTAADGNRLIRIDLIERFGHGEMLPLPVAARAVLIARYLMAFNSSRTTLRKISSSGCCCCITYSRNA